MTMYKTKREEAARPLPRTLMAQPHGATARRQTRRPPPAMPRCPLPRPRPSAPPPARASSPRSRQSRAASGALPSRPARAPPARQSSSDAELERLLLGVGRAPDLLPRALLVRPVLDVLDGPSVPVGEVAVPAVELNVAGADALAPQGVPMVQRGFPRIFFSLIRDGCAQGTVCRYTRACSAQNTDTG